MSRPPSAPKQHAPRKRPDTTMRIRPGAFELRKRGVARWDLSDPYHFAAELSWPGFLLLFVALLVAINVAFAGLYLLQPGSISNARPGSLADPFFFSLETLATVGYGEMYPGTLYGHAVSSTEIIVGMAFVAIMTGLTFVRFSRPRGKILFAGKAVIAIHNGEPTLMVRIGNGRSTTLTDATARLSVLLKEMTLEGNMYRGVHDLPLLRRYIPLFPLTWTLMHRIDRHSPLYGRDPAELARDDTRIFVSVEARDPILAAQIYAIRDYGPTEYLPGKRYADAVSIDDRGRTVADLDRIGLVEDDPFALAHA